MTTTDASTRTAEAGAQGTRLIRRLVVINMGLVALQALSGFLMSGYARGEDTLSLRPDHGRNDMKR